MVVEALSRRALVAGLVGCGVAGKAAGAVRAGGVTDLMPGFWHVMDQTQGLPTAVRAARVVQDYLQPNAAVFSAAGLGKLAPVRIEPWLTEVEPLLPAIRKLDGRIEAVWLANQTVFRREFPKFDPRISPAYFMPSFFSFDAHLEPHDGVLPLFVGLDGIVRYHGTDPDLGVLLAHELFHCEHAQRSPSIALEDPERLYKSLWGEGLATYVSERMNPKASRLEVLLDAKALDQQGDRFVRVWAQGLLDNLDSTSGAEADKYFGAGYRGAWPAPEVRRLMAVELARLARA